jgi:hypothetical protein
VSCGIWARAGKAKARAKRAEKNEMDCRLKVSSR